MSMLLRQKRDPNASGIAIRIDTTKESRRDAELAELAEVRYPSSHMEHEP